MKLKSAKEARKNEKKMKSVNNQMRVPVRSKMKNKANLKRNQAKRMTSRPKKSPTNTSLKVKNLSLIKDLRKMIPVRMMIKL